MLHTLSYSYTYHWLSASFAQTDYAGIVGSIALEQADQMLYAESLEGKTFMLEEAPNRSWR